VNNNVLQLQGFILSGFLSRLLFDHISSSSLIQQQLMPMNAVIAFNNNEWDSGKTDTDRNRIRQLQGQLRVGLKEQDRASNWVDLCC